MLYDLERFEPNETNTIKRRRDFLVIGGETWATDGYLLSNPLIVRCNLEKKGFMTMGAMDFFGLFADQSNRQARR